MLIINPKQDLLYRIESCRKKMIELAKERSLASIEVVQLSWELDSLLNEYQLTEKRDGN
jgi:hypothetical protein